MEVQYIHRCSQAFIQCRQNNGEPTQCLPLPRHGISVRGDVIPVDKIHGPGLIATCAEQIARSLTSTRLDQLWHFLQQVGRNAYSTELLQARLDERLTRFRSEEVSLSGGVLERLSTLGGPVSALLGSVLHV